MQNFKTLCSRDTHYIAHVGIGNDSDDWEQVSSYNGGHWYGKVFSESDINFTLKPLYKIDLLDCIPVIVTLGIIVIVAVVVIYATPIIAANITALCEACTAFGIKQGLALYMTFGAEVGCSVISLPWSCEVFTHILDLFLQEHAVFLVNTAENRRRSNRTHSENSS